MDVKNKISKPINKYGNCWFDKELQADMICDVAKQTYRRGRPQSDNPKEPDKTSVAIDNMTNAAIDAASGLRVKRGVVNRVLMWWASQPAAVRTAILDDTDEGMELAYAEALERLAADLRRKVKTPHRPDRLQPGRGARGPRTEGC